MTYEMILKRYSHLSDDELRQEIKDRTARRYSTSMVGSDDCMIDANVLRACRELLDSRATLEQGVN